MDANALPENTDYENLPETYVIFITETDVLGSGQPLYIIRRTVEGTGALFDDGSHIVYVNSEIVDTSTPLGRLMHDFRCATPEEMYYDVLAERTKHFKTEEEGAISMNMALEGLIREVSEVEIKKSKEKWTAEGMERGAESAHISAIRQMMAKLALTAEKAMDVLAIPKSEWERYKTML